MHHTLDRDGRRSRVWCTPHSLGKNVTFQQLPRSLPRIYGLKQLDDPDTKRLIKPFRPRIFAPIQPYQWHSSFSLIPLRCARMASFLRLHEPSFLIVHSRDLHRSPTILSSNLQPCFLVFCFIPFDQLQISPCT